MLLRRRRREWTPEEDERLRSHIASGGSAARASVILKRTESAVRARATELDLRFPTIRALRTKASGVPQAGGRENT